MKKIICFITILMTISCQKEILLERDVEVSDRTELESLLYYIPDTSVFTFIYKGETYKYETRNDNYSETITTRSSLQNGNTLYQSLLKEENLCTVVKENGILEIYKDIDEYLDVKLIVDGEIVQTRSSGIGGQKFYSYLRLFDRDFFLSGDIAFFQLRASWTRHYAINLFQLTGRLSDSPEYKNMKVKSFYHSFQITGEPWPENSILYTVLFEGGDYSGQSLVYERRLDYCVEYDEYTVAETQLSKIGWADRIKSACILITCYY